MSEHPAVEELDPADAAAAASAVDRALRWTLTEPGWQRATAALEKIQDAVARRDPLDLQSGLDALAESGPRRVATRVTADLGSVETSPAPHATVQLANQIEHSLGVADEDAG
jgi:hypothetical protein